MTDPRLLSKAESFDDVVKLPRLPHRTTRLLEQIDQRECLHVKQSSNIDLTGAPGSHLCSESHRYMPVILFKLEITDQIAISPIAKRRCSINKAVQVEIESERGGSKSVKKKYCWCCST